MTEAFGRCHPHELGSRFQNSDQSWANQRGASGKAVPRQHRHGGRPAPMEEHREQRRSSAHAWAVWGSARQCDAEPTTRCMTTSRCCRHSWAGGVTKSSTARTGDEGLTRSAIFGQCRWTPSSTLSVFDPETDRGTAKTRQQFADTDDSRAAWRDDIGKNITRDATTRMGGAGCDRRPHGRASRWNGAQLRRGGRDHRGFRYR